MSDNHLVRLSVNINTETHDALKEISGKRHITITEAVRRAVSVWKFIEDSDARGETILIEQANGKYRELVILP